MKDAHPLQLEMVPIVTAPVKKATWGGKRAGAGRKKLAGGPKSVPHRSRAKHARSRPVHLTMRARRGLPSFRHQLVLKMMLKVLARQGLPHRTYAGRFHVVHFSIQSNHLHVLIEADDKRALRSGASGLVIAFAKALAKIAGWPGGKVWGERFHSRELGSPREVKHALVYLFANFKKHGNTITHGEGIVDRYSSAVSFAHWRVPPRLAIPIDAPSDAPFIAEPLPPRLPPPPWEPAEPNTWLLGKGWKDHYGPLSTNDSPA